MHSIRVLRAKIVSKADREQNWWSPPLAYLLPELSQGWIIEYHDNNITACSESCQFSYGLDIIVEMNILMQLMTQSANRHRTIQMTLDNH